MKNAQTPTPRELISEFLDQQHRTVTGLAATIEYAQTTLAALALADVTAEDEDEGAGDGESNKATSGAKSILYKSVLAEAFPVTSKYGLKFLTVEAGEEARLLGMLALLGPTAGGPELSAWAETNRDKLVSTITGIGTHSSRFAKTSTNFVLFHKPEEPLGAPYLSSASVTKAITLSYFGNAATMPVARVLYGHFRYERKIYSLYEALREKNQKFLDNSGISQVVQDALHCALSKPVELPDRIAQLHWPLGNGEYVCLSPLPSVAVLDAIAAAHKYDPDKDSMKGRYLPRILMRVGGAKPQNGGSLNSALKGEHLLYRTQVYPLKKDAAALMIRKLWKGHALTRISNDLVEKLSSDVSQFSSDGKDKWLTSVLKPAAYQCLGFLKQTKEALSQDMLEVEPALAERIVRNKAMSWLLDDSPEAVEKLSEAFAAQLFRQVPKLQASEDLRPRVFLQAATAVAYVISKEQK